MSEWKEVTLTDISSDISYGYTESAKSEKIGPKFLRITDIANGRLNWDSVPYCPISIENFSKYKLNPGDIVVARTGATTGANYTIKVNDPTEAVFASYLIRYRIDRKYAEPNFIGQVLRSITWQDYVNSIAGGSAQPGANAKQLGSFPILLPPLPEQRAIASVLSSLDDKIDLLHRQNKTLEAMAETLFRQWFVEEADDGWEEGKLSQLVEIQSGFAFKSEIFVDIGKYKLITIKAVQDGYLELNNADEINEIPPRMPSYCHLIEKDILLSLTGNVGRCCMVDKLNLLLNQRVAKVHPKNENDRAFAYFYFRLRDTRQQLEEMAKGTAQLNLSPVETANMILSIPSRDLLDKFSEISTPLFEGILRNKKNISTLEKLRDTLLPKLMSGEVRVECS